MINMNNEFNDFHKKFLEEEIKNELIEILMEKLQEKLKQNIQRELNIKTTQIKKLEKTHKQLNELTKDCNKSQSETKENIKKGYMK
jgi:hypothetical protein